MGKVRLAAVLTLALALWPATLHAISFDLTLDPSQAVPAPVLGGATPSGTATLDVNTITGGVSVTGSYTGMTSDTVAAHLHGLAPPGTATDVLVGFGATGGTAGTLSGSGALSSTVLRGLLEGQTYVNVHTVNNGPGEIRGQVVDPDILFFGITLSPGEAVPAPTLNGSTPTGTAQVVVDIVTGAIEISGTYDGMTSDVVAAHLHGLAPPGTPTDVIFGFNVSGATIGTFDGMTTLSSQNLAGLLSGQTYVNVHTGNNGPGEIRGQVPEPGTFVLVMLGTAGLGLARRRGVI